MNIDIPDRLSLVDKRRTHAIEHQPWELFDIRVPANWIPRPGDDSGLSHLKAIHIWKHILQSIPSDLADKLSRLNTTKRLALRGFARERDGSFKTPADYSEMYGVEINSKFRNCIDNLAAWGVEGGIGQTRIWADDCPAAPIEYMSWGRGLGMLVVYDNSDHLIDFSSDLQGVIFTSTGVYLRPGGASFADRIVAVFCVHWQAPTLQDRLNLLIKRAQSRLLQEET